MTEDRDPLLSQLFADRELALRDTEFLQALRQRIDREQLRRRFYQRGALTAALGGIALLVPWLLEPLTVLMDLVASGLHALGSALQSPIAWAAGAALVIALAPAIYLWRTRRF